VKSPANIVRAIVTKPLAILAVVALVVLGIWVVGTRTQPHQVRAVFQAATNLYNGEDVKVNGIDVGEVTSISYQVDPGNAVVGLGIRDSQFWPLHQGTQANLRFGTTIGNGTREVDLTPGPNSAPAIPQNGVIPVADTQSTVEFDQAFGIFNPATRTNLQGTMQGLDKSFSGHQQQLATGLAASPGGLSAVAGFMADLSQDQYALGQIVRNGDTVTRTLAANQAQIETLLTVAGETFNTFAQRTANTQASITGFAPTINQARTTFVRLDTSLGHLTGLVNALRPGARQLIPLARSLTPALSDLRATVPTAVATVRTATKASPQISSLLTTGVPFMQALTPVATQLAPDVACIRPYAPEVAAFFSNWASFTQGFDAHSHYARTKVIAGATAFNSDVLPPSTFTKLTGQGYAFPRPPGLNAGQPWLLPQCGVGPNALNPAADPEAGG
jgi:virulence factor Mce-like protein